MTILVDEARWPWRDTYWCHLVSDDNLDELHDFARRLGCRRVGFQGDHYDIDVDARLRALELGAEACDSRTLVRRMKAAELRLRPSQFTKWSLVDRAERPTLAPAESVAAELRSWLPRADGYFRLIRERPTGGEARATILFGDSTEHPLPAEDPATGVFVRSDQEGAWAIEYISPPPTAAE